MRRDRLAVLGGFLLAAALPGSAFATNGYFTVGLDAESKGEAGVGVSSGDGPEAAALNPALGVKAGNSVGGGLGFFSPNRDVTTSGGSAPPGYDIANGKFISGDDLFLIPYLGANYQLDGETAVSLLLYANGGMNTHYGVSPYTKSGGPVGVDLEQVFITPNLARKVGYGITLGAAPVFAVQRFAAQGLQPFARQSSDPLSLTNNSYDYSYGIGVKLGATWDPAEKLTLGVAYQTTTWMTNFDNYRGLFAGGGNFDVPPQITAGLTVRPLATLDLSLEYQRIFYGSVKSIANAGNYQTPLGSAEGPGFGWNDVNVFRIGVQWKVQENLVLRTGFSHATNFTTGGNALFNILAPATPQNHFSVGAGYDISPNWNISVAYVHAFSSTLNGWNQNDPTQTIKLRMDHNEGTIGATYRF